MHVQVTHACDKSVAFVFDRFGGVDLRRSFVTPWPDDIWWQAQSIVASSMWPLCWPFYRQIHSLRSSYIFTL